MEFDNQGMLQRESGPNEDDASEIIKVCLANNPHGLLPIAVSGAHLPANSQT